ncbi:MAG: transpeptidase family protein [Prevotella sp.]|nr:transpeptidase family protein [Prevotella sp.]
MSKPDNNIISRYVFISVLFTVAVLLILGKALYTMTAKRDYWEKVAEKKTLKNQTIPQRRGNILSSEGALLASSLPEYGVFMDFEAGGEKKDSLWQEKLDSICMGLHEIFPDISAEEFAQHLEQGRKEKKRHYPIIKRRVSYTQLTEIKRLPIFNMPKYFGGFHEEANNARSNPFGLLASKTIGDMYRGKDSARLGLELSFDSVLSGSPGLKHNKKVLNEMVPVIDREPVDGDDIVTTLDMKIQDLAEKAVVEELKEIDGDVGVAIVMEVATGDIKAMVNMEKTSSGAYMELQNHAVSDMLEPGSVFKTVSMMVALDDGVVDTTYRVDTGNGVRKMHGADMRDHNWRKGGYGTISVPKILQVSSNIGVSYIIDHFYEKDPDKYVQGVYRTGIAEDLKVPLQNYHKPSIRRPERNSRGQLTNWYKTTLPWMSIGYETMVPPISTVTFYNAIANNGRMMRPRLVKRVERAGKVIKEYPPVVVREQICKPTTLSKIQTMLRQVVSIGLGKKAGSPTFPVSGKTGTAQIAKGKKGYHSGTMHYLVSFAGYFPSDQPKYSCIVCIQKPGPSASGGGMAGPVFRKIAEGIMARDLRLSATDAKDDESSPLPDVKNGDIKAAQFVLSKYGIESWSDWQKDDVNDNMVWGLASIGQQKVNLTKKEVSSYGVIPDVNGMGARDAVYLIEASGAKARVEGRGRVVTQSLPAGHRIVRGDTCTIRLR